jgi:RNA polymerase sigma-70 factor (ECF subfamily)
VQEALAKAWANIRTLREPRYFRTWLIRILLNECYRILRRGKHAESELPQEYAGFDAPGEDTMDLRNALMSLPEDQRTAIVLFHVEDLTVDEIARVMKVPPGTVKSRLSRARTKLAAVLRPKED